MSNVRIGLAIAAGAVTTGALLFPVLNRRAETPAAAQSRGTEAPATVVQVAVARLRPMERTLRLSGTLKSGSEARLAPKLGGRVLAVYVRPGDPVRRGQALVRLDTSDVARQAEQARAGAAAARAVWEKAREGAELKRVDVERRVTEAEQGVEQARLQVQKAEAGIRLQRRAAQADVDRAQAGVDAARSTLAKAQKGARPEQRRQAEIGVRQAERGVEIARKRLDDVEFLYGKGGVPRIRLDEAREGLQKAQDGVDQARAQLALVEAGATPEEIAAAEAQVRSAEAGLAAARTAAGRHEVDDADLASARLQLQRAEAGLKSARAARAELDVVRKDIQAARADYDRARAAADLASQQVGSGTVVSPVDGLVTTVNTNAGEMAGPGMPVVSVVGTAGVYMEAAVPARLLAELRQGQSAEVTVAALPGRTFTGTVRSVGGVAASDGRSFIVEIGLSAPVGLLKPGGQARAQVTADRAASMVSVPVEAVRTDGDASVVWVVRQGRVEQVPVETPAQDASAATVRGDIHAGDPVILSAPPGLGPGDAVQTQVREP